MATEIEAARALVYRAAWLRDQGRDYGLAAAQAKLFASEVAARATNAALLLHGGYGYVDEYPGRPVPARREADRDRRGDERHPAARDRAQDPRPAGPVARWPCSARGSTPRPTTRGRTRRRWRRSSTSSARGRPPSPGDGAAGDAEAIARHRERGKLPVRERIDRLLDPGAAFLELSPLAADGLHDGEAPGAGIVTGIGPVEGTPVP